ncbi:choice-of-anchor M domain-containing protein, partial [Patulibacter sp. S7RM1-6]
MTHAPRRALLRRAVALWGIAILLLLVVGAAAAGAARPYVLTKGHIDALSPTIEDGQLRLRLSDDSRIYGSEGHVIRDVDDVLLNLHDGAKTTLDGALPAAYQFLGLQPGDEYWAVDFSGTNQSSVIWTGWDTNHASVADVDEIAPGRYFRVRLVDIAGPADAGVHIYQPNGASARIFASTTPGAWQPDETRWPGATGPNAWTLWHQHEHAAWIFTKPGLYQLTFAIDAQKDGKPLTASADYRFYVGDLPASADPDAPDAGLTDLELSGAKDAYPVGQAVSLAVRQQPESGEDHYHWYTRCGTENPWRVVSGASGSTHAFPMTAELDGCTVQARLYDADHELVALSTPHELVAQVAPTVAITGLRDHYHPGDTATLVATQEPDSGENHWHWFLQCGDNPQTVVNGATASTLSLPLEARHDGCTVVAKLYDHAHAVIAESPAVVLHVTDHADGGTPDEPAAPTVPDAPQPAAPAAP